MGYLKVVDIKSDMPPIETALRRLDEAIENGKRLGAGAVKIIHGYGSTGKGGRIRTAVRARLDEYAASGRICALITGEKLSIFDDTTRRAFSVCPELRSDEDMERGNRGITIVILKKI